jgi:hypothetical protein
MDVITHANQAYKQSRGATVRARKKERCHGMLFLINNSKKVIKSIPILILPVLLFFVYSIVSFVEAAVLSSACKE